MKGVAAAVGVFLAVVLPWGAAAGEKTPPSPILLLPGVKEPYRLRLDVVMDGRLSTAAWDAFLDRFFDFFDRDGDGSLSRAEADRMCPLPLPGRKELTIDFVKLDANGNDKASREELRSFCRTNGFSPVVTLVESPSVDDLRLAEMLFRRLDRNGDGKLAQAELRQAPESLRKFDLNDDEYLDLPELLASASSDPRPVMAAVKWGTAGADADAVIRLDVGAKAPAASIDGKGAKRLQLAAAAANGFHRLHDAEGRWSMTVRTTRVLPDVGSARDFLLAQFKAALGDRAALAKTDLEQDATLSGLLELLRYADRNGDNRLSLAELEDYLKVVDLGVQAAVWIQVTDHGPNPFSFLDADGDGRLSYRELVRVRDLLSRDTTEATRLPWQFQLSFGGPSATSWGGVPIPAAARRSRPGTPDAAKAPHWFQAMDRNGDGAVSPREFVGPPDVFRKLDTDGDGVISPEEAARNANH